MLLLILLPHLAAAQAVGASRSFTFALDNDLIAVRGAGPPPDYDYTHGTSVAVAWAGAPHRVRRLAGGLPGCGPISSRASGACLASGVAVRQRILTPRRDAATPVPGERPYAGWLAASAIVHRVAPGRVRSLEVEAGITGPHSLAEDVQDGVHRMLGNEPQLGWAHQVRTGPAAVVRYEDTRRAEWTLGRSTALAAAARWGGALGTLVTALSAEGELTLGLRANDDAVPWSPATPEVERPTRVYLRTGYRQDAVLRDVFVEGRGSSGHAVRRALVGQVEGALGYRRRRIALEYRHVVRGREYDAQPAAHAYGSIAFIVHGF